MHEKTNGTLLHSKRTFLLNKTYWLSTKHIQMVFGHPLGFDRKTLRLADNFFMYLNFDFFYKHKLYINIYLLSISSSSFLLPFPFSLVSYFWPIFFIIFYFLSLLPCYLALLYYCSFSLSLFTFSSGKILVLPLFTAGCTPPYNKKYSTQYVIYRAK